MTTISQVVHLHLYVVVVAVFFIRHVYTQQDLVFVADYQRHAILYAPLSTFNFQHIPLSDVEGPWDVSYNDIENQICWTDIISDSISCSNIDGTQQRVVTDNTLYPTSIAIYTPTAKIYWTDHDRQTLEVCNWDGSERRVIINDLISPSGIAIDYKTGRVIWVDYALRGRGLIESANLDGTDRRVLIQEDLSYPRDITVTGGKMYWCDNGRESIDSANTDGSQRQELYQDPTYQSTFWSVAVVCEDIIWSDSEKGRLLTMPVDMSVQPKEAGTSNFTEARGVYVYSQGCRAVNDTIPPVITKCPSTVRVSTTAENITTTVSWTEPMATDDSGVTPIRSMSHTPGSQFPVGKTTVTYNFTDESGNTGTCTFEVKVSNMDSSGSERPSSRVIIIGVTVGAITLIILIIVIIVFCSKRSSMCFLRKHQQPNPNNNDLMPTISGYMTTVNTNDGISGYMTTVNSNDGISGYMTTVNTNDGISGYMTNVVTDDRDTYQDIHHSSHIYQQVDEN